MSDRVLLDTCVLYPTLLRALLLATARAGLFTPLWSDRIMDEWRHAAARSGPVEAELVSGEITLLTTQFPGAEIAPAEETVQRLSLPDPNDQHVLAAAIDGRADALLTLNLKDFPTRTLTREGVLRYEPDGFLCDLHAAHGIAPLLLPPIRAAETQLRSPARTLLKKARLPRLAKALAL